MLGRLNILPKHSDWPIMLAIVTLAVTPFEPIVRNGVGPMFNRALHRIFLLVVLASLTYIATAQQGPIRIGDLLFLSYGAVIKQQGPMHIGGAGTSEGFNGFIGADLSQVSGGQTMWSAANSANRSPLEGPSGSVSKLDLKAPGKARREFDKGYVLLVKKDYKGAIEHLAIAVTVYPDFVAAHNALGSAYLALGQNDQARDQFAKAVSLDDHLPTSYLNLGCAQLALKDYHSAQQSAQKASSIAPLDLQLATALTFTQFMNQDYGGVLTTAHQIHSRKHEGAAIVHFYAAAAFDGQDKLEDEQNELQTLLQEDPKSPAAEQSRQILAQIKVEQLRREALKRQPVAPVVATAVKPVAVGPTAEQVAAQFQMAKQDSREQKQIAEAEAQPEAMCVNCGTTALPGALAGGGRTSSSAERGSNGNFTLRSVVDEVAVFFAATDHGKSVIDLTREDIGIRDNQKSPASITGFRNEAQLPLRLGIVIDTSESITSRFSFEQHAAIDFLQKTLTNKDDLAFVVGVANSVLLVQDFTNDQQQMSHAVNQLVPVGGTALWDAVSFAADKLSGRAETQPVARMLVVISDGKDNSSSIALKEAVASAQRGEVFVYTVSTREATDGGDYTLAGEHFLVGDRALKVLAEQTGGAAFMPGSVTGLNRGLNDLQQVIRSRYLISYKPDAFKHDGQFRAIDISAQKSGHKLRVYARKGYYAGVSTAGATNF
jgi:Ca-activated chloride channel homolog